MLGFLISMISCTSYGVLKGRDQSFLIFEYSKLKDNEFKKEIASKEGMLAENNLSNQPGRNKANLYIQLAILYSHKNNKEPDFIKALEYLKLYALVRDEISVDYAEDLLNILVENKLSCDILNNKYNKLLEKNKKFEKTCSKFAVKIREQDKKLQKQYKIIKKNNKIIEQLKALDIKLENKRKETE